MNVVLSTQQQQTNTVVVTQQPSAIVYRQYVPTWIGSDSLIYMSIFTMLCCGLIPGIIALAIAWEVSITPGTVYTFIEEFRKSYHVHTIHIHVVSHVYIHV